MWLIIKLSFGTGAEREALALIATAAVRAFPSGELVCEWTCSFPHHHHPLSQSLVPRSSTAPQKQHNQVPCYYRRLPVDRFVSLMRRTSQICEDHDQSIASSLNCAR